MSQQNDELILAVKSVAEALNNNLIEAVFIPFLVVLFAAFATYVFSTRQAEIAYRKQDKSRLAIELIGLITQLQANSVLYWCKDYDRNILDEIALKEAEIHAGIMLVQSVADELISKNMTNGEREELQNVLGDFVSDAYDVITGGDFESTSRTASKVRVQQIVKLCIEARAKISRHC